MKDVLSKPSEARERILQKAEELFYRQGYQATGINQIIDEARVAKATFYAHFPAKEALCLAYLRTVKERELRKYQAGVAQTKGALPRFMLLIESMEPWLKKTEMKGCGFLNLIPEVTDPKSPLRKEGKEVYHAFEKSIFQLTKDLRASDPREYAHLDPVHVAKEYVTILAGAISLVELYHDLEPMRHGVRMVKSLLEKK